MENERLLDPERLGDHVDRLFRAAWALSGSREDAEDLVQETFVKILARPRVLRSDDDLGYLLRVLRNTFFSSRRTAARRPVSAPDPGILDTLEDRAALTPEAQLQTSEVFAAISALPPDFRDALIAIDVAGLSYEETARALRVRVGTVTSRLYRARAQVAKRLEAGGEAGD